MKIPQAILMKSLDVYKRQAYSWEELLDYSKYYDSNLDQGNPILVFTGEYDQKDGPLQMDWFKGLL